MARGGRPTRALRRTEWRNLSRYSIIALGQRVVLVDEALQALVEDVGIDLGRRDVGMTEQLLHRAQVGAAIEQVAGKGMAQHVGLTRSGSRPEVAASSFSSCARRCRVRCPSALLEGNNQRDFGAGASCDEAGSGCR